MKKYDQWMEEIAREQKKKSRDARTPSALEIKYKPLIRKQEQFLRGKKTKSNENVFFLSIENLFVSCFSGVLFTFEFSRRLES